MQERHSNRKQYFLEQGITTKKYVIPYIQDVRPVNSDSRVLEVGCGEGGNLMPFLEMGCATVGVDIDKMKMEVGEQFMRENLPNPDITMVPESIYEVSAEDIGTFDVIMLRDVIEHLPNQDQFFKHAKKLLKPDGVIFFGFPPWCMPFGGHQQICQSKLLSKLPYFHLLPKFLYKFILKAFGESDHHVNELMSIKDTQISINRFNRLAKSNGYVFKKKTFYFINPNYEIKFKLKVREQNKLIGAIPFLRDFLTTCYYNVIGTK